MSWVRSARLVVVAGALAAGVACALEPDPAVVEACKPGEVQCLDDDRIRTCSDQGLWASPESFVCAFGDCMIMGGVAVCM